MSNTERGSAELQGRTHQKWRQCLKDADGEMVIYYTDKWGHQYLSWLDGEIIRYTQPNFHEKYNGPYGTDRDLFKRMVEDGRMRLVPREDSPFGDGCETAQEDSA